MATSASVYNHQRTIRQILKRNRKEPASLVLHINHGHFRFERQSGIFTFDSPARAFLDCIREQRVPADLLDVLYGAKVRFHESCLIVEVHDHRPPNLASSSSSSYSSYPSGSTAKLNRGAGDPLPPGTLQALAQSSASQLTRTFGPGSGTAAGTLLDRARWPLYGHDAERRRAELAGSSAAGGGAGGGAIPAAGAGLLGGAGSGAGAGANGAGAAGAGAGGAAGGMSTTTASEGTGTGGGTTGPEIYRIVLHATSESLWEDIKALDADLGPGGVPIWSDAEALSVEAGILVSVPSCRP